MPAILILIAISLFLLFTNPLYGDINALRTQMDSYNEALNNSKALENERDKLTAKYNSIDPDNLVRLEKLLPENVDNIRLILEIGELAAPYGMVLKDVKYDVNTNATTPTPGVPTPGGVPGATSARVAVPQNYGIFNLEFSTAGTYDNFIRFTKDLENNLRIVDISSISFASDSSAPGVAGASPSKGADIYKYDFKIKTYWLKN